MSKKHSVPFHGYRLHESFRFVPHLPKITATHRPTKCITETFLCAHTFSTTNHSRNVYSRDVHPCIYDRATMSTAAISVVPSRSVKVIKFGADREPVYDFLLVINSNLDPISHRYWDTATQLAKNRKFCPPPLIWRPRSGWPFSNLWKSFTVPKTRVFQAADGEDLVILACTVFDWSTRVTDRRTDGQNCDG